MITAGKLISDAIQQLNQQGVDVDQPDILYAQRNLARRAYAGEYPWSWLAGHGSVTFASGSAPFAEAAFPADANPRFPVTAWSVIGGEPADWDRTDYKGCARTLGAVPRFHADHAARKAFSNAGDGAEAYLDYTRSLEDLPGDASADSQEEPYPDGMAVTWKLCSFYVFATQGQELGPRDYFEGLYSDQVAEDIRKDQALQPVLEASLSYRGRR
jgi:hypothetical protein